MLLQYVQHDASFANYVTGFSKIKNQDRFQRDVWEGELLFDRVYRPSAIATKSRITYLFPDAARAVGLSHYMAEFAKLIEFARRQNIRVVTIEMPTPGQFRQLLPDEAKFDSAITAAARTAGPLRDSSAALDEPRFYFDTDHLNQVGVTEFFTRYLKAIRTSVN